MPAAPLLPASRRRRAAPRDLPNAWLRACKLFLCVGSRRWQPGHGKPLVSWLSSLAFAVHPFAAAPDGLNTPLLGSRSTRVYILSGTKPPRVADLRRLPEPGAHRVPPVRRQPPHHQQRTLEEPDPAHAVHQRPIPAVRTAYAFKSGVELLFSQHPHGTGLQSLSVLAAGLRRRQLSGH